MALTDEGMMFGLHSRNDYDNSIPNHLSSRMISKAWTLCLVCWYDDRYVILSEELSWVSYVYWTLHHLDSWITTDQLDVTCFFISLFNAQLVSVVNTSILRSLRFICWVISCVVLLWFDVCWCYGVVRLWWCGIRILLYFSNKCTIYINNLIFIGPCIILMVA